MNNNQKQDKDLDTRTKTNEQGVTIFVRNTPGPLPDFSKIPEVDWRVSVYSRLERLEAAVTCLLDHFDADVQKKVKLFNRIKGIWQRILGEFRKEKRYEAFGMRVHKLMENFWNGEEEE